MGTEYARYPGDANSGKSKNLHLCLTDNLFYLRIYVNTKYEVTISCVEHGSYIELGRKSQIEIWFAYYFTENFYRFRRALNLYYFNPFVYKG